MSGERVYSVLGSTAVPARAVTLAEAGLRERSDLQEWVIAHPEILGPGVLVVSVEFDRWRAASGERERDRLDVLGLGEDGRLVVAELKRDKAPDTVEMQAVKYAALVSRFTGQTLVEHFQRFMDMAGTPLDEATARERLCAHVGGDLDDELLRSPRIVLVAGSFPPVVTSTVVWLTEMGLDISIQQVQAYRVHGDHLVVTVSQLFPVPDVEEFTVSPQRAEARTREDARRGRREKSSVVRLVESGVVPDGTLVRLQLSTTVSPEIRALVDAWIDEDPQRGEARWFNDRRAPLEWCDGQRRRPTPIVQDVLRAAASVERSVAGPQCWVLPDGRTLAEAAGSAPASGAFDWSDVHAVMAALPEGRWTTYGDLAAFAGTAAQPLGAHVARCPECTNAHRVLNAQGRVSDGFGWLDSADDRDPRELLASEGVAFDGDVADPARRLTAEELASLVAATVDAD